MFYEGNRKEVEKTQLRLLIRLSRADSRHHPLEDRMIRDVARLMGMEPELVQELREESDSIPLELPELEEDRLKILYNLLFLIRIDREVTPEEMEVCRRIGFQLGLNPHLTDDLLDLMARYADDKLPEDAMLNLVRKYMN